MRSKIKLVVGGLVCAVCGAVAASMFPVHAQMPEPFSRLRPSGSWRVSITAGSPAVTVSSLLTFQAGGGIVGTTIPLACLDAGQQFGGMHGAWQIALERGLPVLQFHLVSDVYQRPLPHDITNPEPDPFDETFQLGSVDIFGTSPITTGGIKGGGTLHFPEQHRCAARYNGPVTFTAEEVPAVQVTPRDQ